MESQENVNAVEVANVEPQGFLAKNKPFLIGGVIALFIFVGGFWYYKQYTSTPEYVVSQMLAAYSKRNVNEFEKYFDVDDFSRMLWTDYKEWWEKDKDSIWSPLRKTIDSVDAVKVTIRNIASGKKKMEELDNIEESNERTVSMARLLDKMHGYSISSIIDEGDTKKFRLTAKTFDEQEFTFELTVKHKGDYWKICELRNVGEICTSFKNFAKESVVSYLKAAQSIQNQYEEMNKAAEDTGGRTWLEYYMTNQPRRLQGVYPKRIKQAISYVEARESAERYRGEALQAIATNPFSSVLNGNRRSYSENGIKYYSQMKQWLEMGSEAQGFSKQECKDLLSSSKEIKGKMDDYDSRVRGLIATVGYKAH